MDEISFDFADYKTILSHRGNIEGIVDSCNINDFIDFLDTTLKNSMSKAKGILINFKIHESQSLFLINDFMSKVYDLANADAEVVFATEQNNYDDKDLIGFEIIITGLK